MRPATNKTLVSVARLLSACCMLLFIFFSTLKAVIVPVLNLDDLTSKASVIVVGRVVSMQQEERTTVSIGGRTYPARNMLAELQIDTILSGTTKDGSLTLIRFVVPDEFLGWRSIVPLSYRIFFLSESSSGDLGLADPYYPSLPAIPHIDVSQEIAIERVIAQLGAVIESAGVPTQERREAILALNSSKNPLAFEALKRSAHVTDTSLRLSVAASLLQHNDISTLEFVEHELLKPDPGVPTYLLQNLSSAIFFGVKDERAIPSLARLLRAGSVETRRAAASALMHTGSTRSIDSLLSALDDPDSQVQFYVVVGLAEITGQSEWRPSTEDFASDPQKYLAHWREFSGTR